MQQIQTPLVSERQSTAVRKKHSRPYFRKYSDYCDFMAAEASKQLVALDNSRRIESCRWQKIRRKMDLRSTLIRQEMEWKTKAERYRSRGQ